MEKKKKVKCLKKIFWCNQWSLRLKRRVKQHIKQNQRENQKRSEDTYKEITQMQHKQENLRGTEKNNEKF